MVRIPARMRTATLPITAPATRPGDGPFEGDKDREAGRVDVDSVFGTVHEGNLNGVLLVLVAGPAVDEPNPVL
jgi:hypothetical protein